MQNIKYTMINGITVPELADIVTFIEQQIASNEFVINVTKDGNTLKFKQTKNGVQEEVDYTVDLSNYYTKTQADDKFAWASTLSAYLPKSGGTMTGYLSMGYNKITSLQAPNQDYDAVHLRYCNEHYLALTGGTVNGTIISGTDASITRSDNSHETWLIGGTNYQNGSSFRATGKDATLAGKFQCIARDGTNTTTLEGTPAGSLKWNGNEVLTTSNGYTQTQINTKLTDGSVTKVGTATKGSATQPIYLNAGVPTVCNAYSLGTWNNVAFSGSSGVVLAPASGYSFSTASGHLNKYRVDTLGRIEVSLRTTITTSNSIAANNFVQVGTLNKKNGSVDVWVVATVLTGSKYYALPLHINSSGAVYLSNTTSSAISLSGAQLQVTFFTN